MLPLPDALRGPMSIEFVDDVCALEDQGWRETRDVANVELPVEARVELDTDHLAGMAYALGADQHLFVATLDPPHRAVHLEVLGWRGQVRVRGRATLELVENTALGPNPLLALANMSRLQIAQALEALCRTPSPRAVSALCYHAAEHPEDLFAVAAAVKAGPDAQSFLVDGLREPHDGAVEVAAYLLGEVGDVRAYAAIDELHVWDRGVFAEAMKKIRARTTRPTQRREEAIAALGEELGAWRWPTEPVGVGEPRWDLWDIEALLLAHEPRDAHPWWQIWSSEPPPNARPFAQLSIVEGLARVVRAGAPLFEVRLDRDAVLETARVSPPPPLGGVLVRVARDTGYRAASVVEIGCLVERDRAWDEMAHEDRGDVLYLAPKDASRALSVLSGSLRPNDA